MRTIRNAIFVKSSARLADCPPARYPEFAFTGRSNVGKSSLINMLLSRKHLAKTSSTPGKTQLINHFLVNESWYIVDLPGYGYARSPYPRRKKMMKLIRDYVMNRQSLVCLLLLIDARLEMQRTDREFLEFLGRNRVPFILVFTKTDKVSADRIASNTNRFKQSMLQEWECLPPVFITSSVKNTGREELLEFIEKTLQ